MASTLKHLRSSSADKRPTASGLADGQLAINTASGTPGLFFKDSNNTIVKVGPAHVDATAPNATPAGSAGNSKGEFWVDINLVPSGLKVWNGSAFSNLTPSGSETVPGLLEVATPGEVQTGTDHQRAVTPSGLQSKISDSTSTVSSTTIASSTAVKSAYDLANAALPKTGGTLTGELLISPSGSLVFEGSTDDGFETTLAVTNPTADRTITFPNVTGTVVTTGDSGTVTSTMIADGTIVNADINASAAITYGKLALASGIVDSDISGSAEIAVSKLADGTARQLLQTDAAGTGVEWASNIDIPGTLDVTSTATFDSSATVAGNLTVDNGTLFVDATNNRVGINTTQTIYNGYPGNLTIANSTPGTLLIVNTSSGTTQSLGDIRFHSNAQNVSTRVYATAVNSDTYLQTEATFFNGNHDNYSFRNVAGTELFFANTYSFWAGSPSTFSIDIAAARVGIGTNAPQADLDVNGIASFGAGAAATPSIAARGDLDTGIWFPAANTTAISTGGNERLRIASTGFVGINTASPGFQLDVNGSIQARGNLGFKDANNTDTYAWRGFSGIIALDTGTAFPTGWNFQYGNTSNSALYITSTGKVGIQDTTPDALLTVNGIASFGAGAAATPSIAARGDLDTGIWFPAANTTAISTGGSERLRIDSSGRLLVGTSSARSNFLAGAMATPLQIEGGAGATASFSVTLVGANANPARQILAKSRGSIGGNTIVVNNDSIGSVSFQGNDGTNFVEAATVIAAVDGTPGTNDMPGRLVFSTTADGASSPTERMRIDSSGRVGIGTASPGYTLDVNGAASFSGSIRSTSTGTFTVLPAGVSGSWTGSGFALQSEGNTAPIGFLQGTSERMRIDSSGRLLVGTSTGEAFSGVLAQFQIQGTDTSTARQSIFYVANDASGPNLTFAKARTTGKAALSADDALGTISFFGSDGVDNNQRGAEIGAYVDGAVSSNDLPGRLVFSTTADGAASPTERMRIDSSGRVGIGTPNPSRSLQVTGANAGEAALLRLENNQASGGVTTQAVSIEAVFDYNNGASTAAGGKIYFGKEDTYTTATTSIDSFLSFYTVANNSQAERMRIDSSGRLLINTSTASTNYYIGASASTPQIQLTGTSNAVASMVIHNQAGIGTSGGANAGRLHLVGGALGTTSNSTNLVANDSIGQLVFSGIVDGTANIARNGASIQAQVADVPTTTSIPTNLTFSTTASGSVTASERLRIDSSGRLLVGTTAGYNVGSTGSALLQSVVTSSIPTGSFTRYTNDNDGAIISLGKSRGTSAGSFTVVQSGDIIGNIRFAGADGTDLETQAASIRCEVDGTPGANDMPGRLVFSTTADGASSPTARMTIYNDGQIDMPDVYADTTAAAANFVIQSDGKLRRSTSSLKYKTDVETLENSYADAILNCRPVWYRSTSSGDNPNWGHWGFIAEEVAEIDPRLCFFKEEEDGTLEPEGVQYDRFVPHLLNLIKRQKEQIEAMEARLTALESA